MRIDCRGHHIPFFNENPKRRIYVHAGGGGWGCRPQWRNVDFLRVMLSSYAWECLVSYRVDRHVDRKTETFLFLTRGKQEILSKAARMNAGRRFQVDNGELIYKVNEPGLKQSRQPSNRYF